MAISLSPHHRSAFSRPLCDSSQANRNSYRKKYAAGPVKRDIKKLIGYSGVNVSGLARHPPPELTPELTLEPASEPASKFILGPNTGIVLSHAGLIHISIAVAVRRYTALFADIAPENHGLVHEALYTLSIRHRCGDTDCSVW